MTRLWCEDDAEIRYTQLQHDCAARYVSGLVILHKPLALS